PKSSCESRSSWPSRHQGSVLGNPPAVRGRLTRPQSRPPAPDYWSLIGHNRQPVASPPSWEKNFCFQAVPALGDIVGVLPDRYKPPPRGGTRLSKCREWECMASEKNKYYRPSDREPFMNERQRDYFRLKLLAWKEDILKEARETLQHLQDENQNH